MQNYNSDFEKFENEVKVTMNQLSFTEIFEGYYPVQFT